MAFRTESPDTVEAVGYARQANAQDVLERLNYLMDDYVEEEKPYSYSGDVYQPYKITITIEPA